jgi:hypothetical protein
MGNVIKYTTTPVNNSIKKGNFALGINDIDYGPTNITGFYSTTIPSTSGYTVYNENGGTLSYESVSGTTPLINYLSNKRGVSMTTAGEALSWAAGQSNIFVTNREYENIVTSGMVLNLDAGFVSSYPTSATTWYDLSYSGNNGTLTNGPTFSSLSGGSIVFDGVDDYVNCGNNNSLKITGPITINTIFKVNSFTNDYQAIVSMGDDSYRFQRNAATNKLAFGSRNIGLTDLISTTNISGNTWYITSAVYNGSTMQIYINGVLDAIGNASGSLPASSYNLLVGGNAQFPARAWDGYISNVQIYNRGLSPFEVYQNYNSMKGRFGIPDIVTSGLTLNLDAGNPYSYNPLNTGSTNWTDISGYGNNGVLTNGAFYSGGTMVFDGVNDYSLTTNPSILQSQNLTLSVWIKPNTATNVITGIVDYDHAQSQGWVLQSEDATTNRNYYFAYFDGVTFQPSTGISVGKGIKITNFEWQNLVFVKSGTSITGYFNGSQIYQSTAGSGNISYQPNKNLGIANVISINGRQYRGSISNVQVYNRPISPFEVYQNFNSLKNRYGFSDIVTEGLILNLDAGNPYSYNPLNTGSTTWVDTTYTTTGGTLTNGTFYSGGTMVFDGTNDYVRFNSGLNGRISFSLEYWFYQNAIESRAQEMFTTNYNNPGIEIYSNGTTLYFRSNFNNSSRPATVTISAGRWNHVVAICRVDSGITIYLNGVEGTPNTPTNPYITWNDDYFNLGVLTGYSEFLPFNGKISNAKIYNRALSASEVQQNFNALRGRYGI